MSNLQYSTGASVQGERANQPGGERARREQARGRKSQGVNEPGGEMAKGRKSQTLIVVLAASVDLTLSARLLHCIDANQWKAGIL